MEVSEVDLAVVISDIRCIVAIQDIRNEKEIMILIPI